jgi:hypothetical protein
VSCHWSKASSCAYPAACRALVFIEVGPIGRQKKDTIFAPKCPHKFYEAFSSNTEQAFGAAALVHFAIESTHFGVIAQISPVSQGW